MTYIAEGEAPAEWGCDTYWQTMDASDLVLEKCVAVFGVLYALGTETEPMLAEIISNSPLEAHTSVPLPGTVNLNSMLPASMDSYISYRGSLVRSPCCSHVYLSCDSTSPSQLLPGLLLQPEQSQLNDLQNNGWDMAHINVSHVFCFNS